MRNMAELTKRRSIDRVLSDKEMEYLLENDFPTPYDYMSIEEELEMMEEAGYFDKRIKELRDKKGMTQDAALRKCKAEDSIKMLKAKELRISRQLAREKLYIIDGKTAAEAELINFLIRRGVPGVQIRIVENTKTSCQLASKRPTDEHWETTPYTIDDAAKLGITERNKYHWTAQPDNMLYNRCMTRMGRRHFADVIHGVSYTPEEMGAIVNTEGKPVEFLLPQPPTTNGGGSQPTVTANDKLEETTPEPPDDRWTEIVAGIVKESTQKGVPVYIVLFKGGKGWVPIADAKTETVEGQTKVIAIRTKFIEDHPAMEPIMEGPKE
jgi:hypothetical protein